MTLQQLKYVAEISKCGSITSAAKKMFIAQPSMSKAVKELEAELDITIFERNRRGAVFTAEGMELLGYTNLILEQANNLKENFCRHDPNEEELKFSISAQHYIFAVDALIDLINDMENRCNYTVTIREGRTSQVINDVQVQQSQIGIIFVSNTTSSFMNRLFVKNGLEFSPLMEFSPYVYVNRRHPLAKFSELSIEQLAPYPYVRYEQGVDSHYYSEEVIVLENITKSVYVTDRSTMLSLIKNTNAFNIGSGCLLPNVIDSSIISIPIRDRLDRMMVGWLKLKNMVLRPELAEYVNMLSASLEKCMWGRPYKNLMEDFQ